MICLSYNCYKCHFFISWFVTQMPVQVVYCLSVIFSLSKATILVNKYQKFFSLHIL